MLICCEAASCAGRKRERIQAAGYADKDREPLGAGVTTALTSDAERDCGADGYGHDSADVPQTHDWLAAQRPGAQRPDPMTGSPKLGD